MTDRPTGFVAIVIWYWVTNVAVYVVSALMEIVLGLFVTASFHWLNRYCTPGPPGCGLWASIVCVVPAGNRWLAGEDVQVAAPSNLTLSGEGFVAIVIVNRWSPAK